MPKPPKPMTFFMSNGEQKLLLQMARDDVRMWDDQIRFLILSEAKRRGMLPADRTTREEPTMKVQTVTVEIHEKRAHPSEMGHRDASVSYTVQVEEGESAETAVVKYQFVARQQVADELDRWIAEIEAKEQIATANSSVYWAIQHAQNDVLAPETLTEFEEHLALLPENERADHRAKLTAAQAMFKEKTERSLNRYIALAREEKLSWHDTDGFESYLADVPPEEQQTWRDRMTEAVAAYELANAPRPAPEALGINDDPMAAERELRLAGLRKTE